MYGRVEPRQLPGHACGECRRKKLRCDRQRPQCSACASAGSLCKFSGRRGRGAGEKHSASRPATLRHDVCEPRLRLDEPLIADTLDIQLDEDHDVVQQLAGQIEAISNRDLAWHGPPVMSGEALSLDTSPTLSTDELLAFQFPTPSDLQSQSSAQRKSNSSDLVNIDLAQLFIDRVHPNIPIINCSKLHERMSEIDDASPYRECLYDAIYTFAAALSSQFSDIEESLYSKSRAQLEHLEFLESDSDTCNIEHIQAWILISFYEFSRTNYRRGWISAGRVFRLVQLAKLSDLDNPARPASRRNDDNMTLEEKRRTFWAAYCLDRLLSLSGHGPANIDEQMIRTRLPSLDSDSHNDLAEPEVFLPVAMSSSDRRPHSQLAECAIILTICHRVIQGCTNSFEMLCSNASLGIFERYDWLDAMLTCRLNKLHSNYNPSTSANEHSMTVFLYMIAYAGMILLCNSAEKSPAANERNQALVLRFQERGLWAAQQIARLSKEHQHHGLFKAHTFLPFAIYLSAERLAKHLKTRRDGLDAQVVEAIEASRRIAHQSLEKLMQVNRLADHYLALLRTS